MAQPFVISMKFVGDASSVTTAASVSRAELTAVEKRADSVNRSVNRTVEIANEARHVLDAAMGATATEVTRSWVDA